MMLTEANMLPLFKSTIRKKDTAVKKRQNIQGRLMVLQSCRVAYFDEAKDWMDKEERERIATDGGKIRERNPTSPI